jgi:hypothetical protein
LDPTSPEAGVPRRSPRPSPRPSPRAASLGFEYAETIVHTAVSADNTPRDGCAGDNDYGIPSEFLAASTGTSSFSFTDPAAMAAGADESRPEITSIDLSGGSASQVLMGDSEGRVCLYAPPANHPKALPVKQRVPRIWHPAFTRGLDCLRSVEVEARVTRAVLLPRRAPNVTSYMVANAQTVKMYRMREHLDRPKSKSVVPVCSFTGPHNYAPIHSLSLCSDEQTFLSADDFQVQWWHFESGDGAKPFCLADIHPRQGDAFEVSELLTAASFHPTHGSLFIVSSSDGWTSIGDLRDPPSRKKRNYATTLTTRPEHNVVQHSHNDILCSVADAAFLQANYVVTRDYLSLKVWDIRKSSGPTSTLPVHECLAGHIDELYDNDAIFDRFSISVDQQTGTVVSGLYDARVVVWQPESGQEPFYIRGSTNDEGSSAAGATGPLQWSEDPSFTSERVTNVGISGGGSTVAFSSHDKLFVFDRVRSGSTRS